MPERHASTPTPLLDTGGRAGRSERVAVLLPLPLEGAYDYLVPAELDLPPGSLVLVPLGARELPGVVWGPGTADKTELPDSRLKSVLSRYPLPPFTEAARRFVDWVANYTLAPRGAVLRMALSVRQALDPPRAVTLYALRPGASEGGGEGREPPRLTPARQRVVAELEKGPARPLSELARAAGVSTSVVKGLLGAGLLECHDAPVTARLASPDWRSPGPELSREQADAARDLGDRLEAGGFGAVLIDGVTGSGKTEVYFEAIAKALSLDRQVLVLLPEIALSAQWLERFARRFGAQPAVWHSDLTAVQRRATWRAVAEGEARVVVGARSALFLPYGSLGLIVVDEEQDSAFKQEDGVIYNARDMAVVRARLGDFPVVLASATPSLETLVNVQSGRYGRLSLPDRHGVAELPEVRLLDLREDPPPRLEGVAGGAGQSWLSPKLRAAMAETLAAQEQVMLFLNRRGYAPLTLCRACGYRLQCPNCTAWLVEHRLAAQLQCHHCGYGARLPRECPDCGAEGSLAACGPGVERLGEEVARLFPDARQAIMASDTLGGPAAAAEMIRRIQEREVDVLIGTQIVAKGHHFPHLTLVGVVDGDLGLHGGDLRAAERTYQLMHQVAGRAGRAEHPGLVLLQTLEPDHPVMQALASGDRDRFMKTEAAHRRRAGMPPFGRLAALILSAPDAGLVDRICADLARNAPRGEGIQTLGPAPAPLAVLRGRHRRRFLLKTRRDIAPQGLVRKWLEGLRLPAPVRLQIDIDPYSFL
jgi:primosomal protein N' (replication factor Y)